MTVVIMKLAACQVSFLMRGYKGPDYKELSEESVLHQVGINFSLPTFFLSSSFLGVLFPFLNILTGCGSVEGG